MAAIFTELLNDWWRHHPLYPSANIATEAARRAIVPLIRRHPIAVLGVAAIAGAVLVQSRGWRWMVRPAVVAGVASQIVARRISQMQSTPAASDRPYERHTGPGSSAFVRPTGRAR